MEAPAGTRRAERWDGGSGRGWVIGGDGPTLRPVPGNSGARAGAARSTQARDHCLASAGARAVGGGDRHSGVLAFEGSRSHPCSLDRPRRQEGAGWPETMGRGRRSSASLRPGCGAPRGGAGAEEHPGTPPRAAGQAPGTKPGGTAASAHLDEELDDGLFVLLLQPVQRHRQRHGRLG